MIFPGDISKMPYLTHGKSRAINAENRTGEKGKGRMAASPLGPSRKGSPCLNNIQPGQEEFLADIEGPGVIQHIWITVDSKTSEGDCFCTEGSDYANVLGWRRESVGRSAIG